MAISQPSRSSGRSRRAFALEYGACSFVCARRDGTRRDQGWRNNVQQPGAVTEPYRRGGQSSPSKKKKNRRRWLINGGSFRLYSATNDAKAGDAIAGRETDRIRGGSVLAGRLLSRGLPRPREFAQQRQNTRSAALRQRPPCLGERQPLKPSRPQAHHLQNTTGSCGNRGEASCQDMGRRLNLNMSTAYFEYSPCQAAPPAPAPGRISWMSNWRSLQDRSGDRPSTTLMAAQPVRIFNAEFGTDLVAWCAKPLHAARFRAKTVVSTLQGSPNISKRCRTRRRRRDCSGYPCRASIRPSKWRLVRLRKEVQRLSPYGIDTRYMTTRHRRGK